MAPKDTEAVELTAESGEKKKQPDKDAEVKLGDTLSEEDKELKERLETCVTTLLDESCEIDIQIQALNVIVTELRTATSSMTSVPKPLKFLRPHYSSLTDRYANLLAPSQLRARLANVLAVLAMTMGKTEERESLGFKLQARKDETTLALKDGEDDTGSWGHEFVRAIAGEIGQEYGARVLDGADPDQDEPFQDLLDMVTEIVPFHISHNAEAEAVDLLIEVQRLRTLTELDGIDANNFQRICLYLIKTADYMSDPDDWNVRTGVSVVI
jgi:26S proteasome regulatory subunit N1